MNVIIKLMRQNRKDREKEGGRKGKDLLRNFKNDLLN